MSFLSEYSKQDSVFSCDLRQLIFLKNCSKMGAASQTAIDEYERLIAKETSVGTR